MIYINTTSLGTINYTYSNLFSACTLYLGGKNDTYKLDGLLSNLVISKTSISSSNYVSVINSLINDLNIKHINHYDGLNRLTSKELYTGTQTLEHTFTYEKNRVKSENIFGDERFDYTYDDMGNIKTITDTYGNDDDNNRVFTYDKYGRLIEEYNEGQETITNYTYDSDGNIFTIVVYSRDREVLTSKSFEYTDNMLDGVYDYVNKEYIYNIEYEGHNPTKINDNDITYEGRRIKTYGSNKYFYNEEGIRVKKIASTGNTHEYTLEGTKILSEKIYTTSNNSLVAQLDYNYDANGQLISVEYNDNIYFYIKDILGNIIKIIDKNNRDIVKYKYNSWGVVTRTICVTTSDTSYLLAQYNPFIYKGYYYDVETGLFWLSSRYYSPELCRFISPDSVEYLNPESINGLNLYAYCGNNPVMGYDPYGTFDLWEFFRGVGNIITGVLAIGAGAIVLIGGAPIGMLIVAGITVGAGVLTLNNGIADTVGSFTGYNYMSDGLFNGNTTAYNWYSGITSTVAGIGTAICGNFIKTEYFMRGATPGTEGKMTLQPGMELDRYGSKYGRFLTNPGTAPGQLNLPASNNLVLNHYKVLKPFKVATGIVDGGGGFQYFTWRSVHRLIQMGYLAII